MTEMQKILNKVLPAYLKSDARLMCDSIHAAYYKELLTSEERDYALKEVQDYIEHLGMSRTKGCLRAALYQADLSSTLEDRERIYRNWADRPMTSPTLEQEWITQALSYGEGIWEGLNITEDVGDLTCTQVGIVKHSIEQLRREPTIQEMRDWVRLHLAKEP